MLYLLLKRIIQNYPTQFPSQGHQRTSVCHITFVVCTSCGRILSHFLIIEDFHDNHTHCFKAFMFCHIRPRLSYLLQWRLYVQTSTAIELPIRSVLSLTRPFTEHLVIGDHNNISGQINLKRCNFI